MILDTNALSDLAKGSADLESLIKSGGPYFLPVPVLGEYRYGLIYSTKRRQLESWLSLAEFCFTVLPTTAMTAICYADTRSKLKELGSPIPEADLWIAALAIEHDLAIISKDRHYDVVPGVRRVEW